METLKEAYMRHDILANEALAEAARLEPNNPGTERRVMARTLRRRGNDIRDAANSLLVADDKLTDTARGRFVQMDMTTINWDGVQLIESPVFEECSFRNVTFTDCDLRSVTFERCDLRGARFVRTNVAGLRLFECDIDGLWFGDEEEFYARRNARPSNSAFCWNGGYIGALTRGVIHSGCTGQAIGLDHLADTGFTGYGSSADYRASRND